LSLWYFFFNTPNTLQQRQRRRGRRNKPAKAIIEPVVLLLILQHPKYKLHSSQQEHVRDCLVDYIRVFRVRHGRGRVVKVERRLCGEEGIEIG
jgi:hypothetical protein